MVLAKLGASSAPAKASTSARCAAMPRSKAGGKCSGRMRSKGGTPKGVVQVSKKGFTAILVLQTRWRVSRGFEKTREERHRPANGVEPSAGLAASTKSMRARTEQARLGHREGAARM